MGLAIVVILADKKYGWDRHVRTVILPRRERNADMPQIWDIPSVEIQSANIIAFSAKLLFTLAATFTRLSLCSFYYRLVKDSGMKWFEWIVHATVAFTIAVCIVFVSLTIFLCTYVALDKPHRGVP